MASSLALTSSGGYLNAIAQRGARRVEPEPALQGDVVDLDHHAVDLVLDVVAVLAVVLDELLDRREVGRAPGPRSLVGSPQAAQRVVRLRTARSGSNPSRSAEAVADHRQRRGSR